jgi:Xaa-Pro aminopeptidase
MADRADECRIKHQKLVDCLTDSGIDAVILTQRHNFAWYTAGALNHVSAGSATGVTSLYISRDRVLAVTNNIEQPRIVDEELNELSIDTVAFDWHDSTAAASMWRELIGQQRVACDVAPCAGLDQIQPLDSKFDRLRWTMLPSEINRYRQLGQEVATALESSCREARVGMSEHELASRVVAKLLARGIRCPVVLVAADDRVARYRHPIPTDRRFERYGMAVAGAERAGLIISNSRLFHFGPVPEDLRQRHKAVCQVDAAMISATRPGQSFGQVIQAAQQAYADAGFADEWRHHHQGGLTGYLGREVKPGPDDTNVVESNQVFAWNPTIAGVKSEDTILVGDQSNEILSYTGDWPTSRYTSQGQHWQRCDILEL